MKAFTEQMLKHIDQEAPSRRGTYWEVRYQPPVAPFSIWSEDPEAYKPQSVPYDEVWHGTTVMLRKELQDARKALADIEAEADNPVATSDHVHYQAKRIVREYVYERQREDPDFELKT